MAIEVSYEGYVLINGVELSDHCKVFKINTGQESREVSAHGNTIRAFRAGIGTAAFEATFRNDLAAGSVEPTLRALISIASTGFEIRCRKHRTGPSATNLTYYGQFIIDGDVMSLDEEHGEVAEISLKCLPYSGAGILTTTSS